MSWLELLLATLGLVGAAVAVGSVLGGEANRTTLRSGAVAVAVVTFLAFASTQIYQTAKFLNKERLLYRGLPAERARENCLVDGGAAGQAAFLDFARRALPAKVRYVVEGPLPTDPACLSFVLLPRLMEATPTRASYAIFTGGIPRGWTRQIVPGSLRTFSRGQLVARLRQ